MNFNISDNLKSQMSVIQDYNPNPDQSTISSDEDYSAFVTSGLISDNETQADDTKIPGWVFNALKLRSEIENWMKFGLSRDYAKLMANWSQNDFYKDFEVTDLNSTNTEAKIQTDSKPTTETNETSGQNVATVNKKVIKAPIKQNPATKTSTKKSSKGKKSVAKKQTEQKQAEPKLVRTPEQELAYQNMLKQSAKVSAHVKEMWEKKDRENNIFLNS